MSPLKAWFLAARPKTLTGAAAPVLMGGVYAYETQGMLTLRMAWVFILCLLFGLLTAVIVLLL